MNNKMGHYLSLRVGTRWYGVPIDEVVEVQHLLLLTELPVAAPAVVGLMRLRESIFPVFDLRRSFGIPDPIYKLNTPIVVLRTSNGLIGLLIDEVDSVEVIASEQIVDIERNSFPYVMGAAKFPDRLLLLLDVMQLTSEVGAVEDITIGTTS
jgi:chemotaxis signal transduction protein